jgi:hypothetical protein
MADPGLPGDTIISIHAGIYPVTRKTADRTILEIFAFIFLYASIYENALCDGALALWTPSGDDRICTNLGAADRDHGRSVWRMAALKYFSAKIGVASNQWTIQYAAGFFT